MRETKRQPWVNHTCQWTFSKRFWQIIATQSSSIFKSSREGSYRLVATPLLASVPQSELHLVPLHPNLCISYLEENLFLLSKLFIRRLQKHVLAQSLLIRKTQEPIFRRSTLCKTHSSHDLSLGFFSWFCEAKLNFPQEAFKGDRWWENRKHQSPAIEAYSEDPWKLLPNRWKAGDVWIICCSWSRPAHRTRISSLDEKLFPLPS